MAPSSRPATTGYERLSQAEEQFSEGSGDEEEVLTRSYASLQPASAPRYAPITQPRPRSGMTSPRPSASAAARREQYQGYHQNHGHGNHHHHHHHSYTGSGGGGRNNWKRVRSNSGVDLKAINARLERWADEIAAKFKRGARGKGKAGEEERLEIHHSVFQAPEGVRPITMEQLGGGWVGEGTMGQEGLMTRPEFEAIVESVRLAIEQGVHPKMISQGSSGSYFARSADGKVVGVFKPKDEEPYAAGNPKWNKWIHRNLFPCCFGRACLIPNLSYVSEAAAYVLDCQLRTHLVPYTDVVNLSSKAFHYPFWDRRNFYRKKKPLPAKPGSFQVFLKGFKDANLFLREHPWPDQYLSGLRTSDNTHRNRRRRWADNCRPTSSQGDGDSDDGRANGEELAPGPDNFVWTEDLKQSFREQLEKLVILDYIMRNTDRGLDNWMIKVDWQTQEVSIASEPIQLNMEENDQEAALGPRPVDLAARNSGEQPRSHPYPAQKPMDPNSKAGRSPGANISIGAIDNSLSWPWKHPDAWRSFPFGWLFLPVDLIGRPFSQSTRDHFLPLLTSKEWWAQTQLALRRVFQLDPDFQERMFARQVAVMKGQAWNVVETLKTDDHGPLELTRRAKVCVWDDLVDVPIAVPMRVTSAEMRRRSHPHYHHDHHPQFIIPPSSTAAAATTAAAIPHRGGKTAGESADDEVDIGAISSSEPAGGHAALAKQHAAAAAAAEPDDLDLLDGIVATPPVDMPHPGRFELGGSSGGHGSNVSIAAAAADSRTALLPPPNGAAAKNDARDDAGDVAAGGGRIASPPRPSRHAAMRNSYHGVIGGGGSVARQQRRFSFAGPGGPSSSSRGGKAGGGHSIAQALYGGDYEGEEGVDEDDEDDYDDLEGDLGYAAAEGMEGNLRKVIVERLEPVKSKNPVFTWC